MSSGPEKNIENQIRKYLRTVGAAEVKIFANAMQGLGYPDLIVCYRGHFIALETKAPDGQLANAQGATLRRFKRAGGAVAVVRSVDHVKKIIEELKNRA